MRWCLGFIALFVGLLATGFEASRPDPVERLPDGVILRLPARGAHAARMVRVALADERTFRVTRTPADAFSTRPSLVVEPAAVTATFTVDEGAEAVTLTTGRARARIDRATGDVAFLGADGRPVLAERRGGARFTPVTVLGETVWRARQEFESPDDEGLYGLGQQQEGVLNWKGHSVDLVQHNIADVVPFFVSTRNYGLFWDNPSRTRFGDARPWLPLAVDAGAIGFHGLTISDAAGAPGGLTAEYFRKRDFTDPLTTRVEPQIAYEFLDVHQPYPEGFLLDQGSARWTGQLVSTESGQHTFRLYASGYFKLWLDGTLVVDGWRQGWLPWHRTVNLPMEAGRKYSVRLEWIPDSGEAHMGLRWRGPAPDDTRRTISLESDVADEIDYYVVVGRSLDDVIGGYRQLTGSAPMMPRWAMGYWQSRERYRSAAELTGTVAEFRKLGFPLDVIVQDWFYWKEDAWGSHEFDRERFPDPAGLVAALHRSNARLMISVWPKFYVGTEHYRELAARDFLYERNVAVKQKDWVGPGYVSTFYDPYAPEARQLFWSQIADHLLPLGVDAWWLDATEPDVTSNLSDHERVLRMHPTALGSGARYENTYSLMHARTFYEGQRAAKPNQRVFILTRSAYAGQQRYAAASWSGDIASRWYDFRTQIPAGLNVALSGLPYWTTDIGGFAVERRNERPQGDDLEAWRELFTRWFQFGAFSPLFRAHGQFPYREPFNVAPPGHRAYETMLAFARLRYRLLPYIYSLAGDVTHRHGTMMRALVMDFPHDPAVRDLGDQYMFGPAFLVAPVTTPMYYATPEWGPLSGATTRRVYLPEGSDWFDFWTGERLAGGQRVDADAPLERMPLYVRSGSIVPMGPALQHTAETSAAASELRIYPGRDGAFTLYEDDGASYAYEQGEFSELPMTWNEEARTLTFHARRGSDRVVRPEQRFRVVLVGSGRGAGGGETRRADRTVRYRGAELRVRLE